METTTQRYTRDDIHHHGEVDTPGPYSIGERIQVGSKFYSVIVYENAVPEGPTIKQVSIIHTDQHGIQYDFVGYLSGTNDVYEAYDKLVLPHANGTLKDQQEEAAVAVLEDKLGATDLDLPILAAAKAAAKDAMLVDPDNDPVVELTEGERFSERLHEELERGDPWETYAEVIQQNPGEGLEEEEPQGPGPEDPTPGNTEELSNDQ